MAQSPIQSKKKWQQKMHWGWRLKVTWVEGCSGEFGQNLKKGWIGNIGGLHRTGGLGTLCQLCYKGLKAFINPFEAPQRNVKIKT